MRVTANDESTQRHGLLAAAQHGDEDAFRDLVQPWRAELHAHCYRMLASADEAEDVVQEALLRAWRGLPRFEGRSAVGSWLYRIATNACLDAIQRRSRRVLPADGAPGRPPVAGEEPPERWIEPYPDAVLEAGRAAPEARYERRESVELAFVAALQHLPPTQRAALLLRDVLGLSAAEAAATLHTTTTAVNSALQHARRRLEQRLPERSQQATLRSLGDRKLRDLVTRYADALEEGDVAAMVALLTEDATWSMPPSARCYRGREEIVAFLVAEPFALDWRRLPTRANGQPALGWYRRDEQRGAHVAEVLEVLTLRGARISAVTAFIDRAAFARFALPDELPDEEEAP